MSRIFNRIVADGISGSQDPALLAMPELFKLMSLHLHKHNCELSLADVAVKRQVRVEDVIHEICILNQGSATDEEHIRKSYFHFDYCAFLFSSEVVLKSEIRAIRNLIDNGFLHFSPLPKNQKAIEIFYGNQPLQAHYLRSELAQCSLLINTPNKLDLDKCKALRHFGADVHQYNLYVKAVAACAFNAKEILNAHPLVVHLLQMDDLRQHFVKVFRDTLDGDQIATRRLCNLIGVFNKTKACSGMSDLEKEQFLETSDVNEMLGEIFNVNGLDRGARMKLLNLICLSNQKADKIITQLEVMDALNGH